MPLNTRALEQMQKVGRSSETTRSAVRALLKESLNNATKRIPLDLWRAIAIRALMEAKPVQQIVIRALNEYLERSEESISTISAEGGRQEDLSHDDQSLLSNLRLALARGSPRRQRR